MPAYQMLTTTSGSATGDSTTAFSADRTFQATVSGTGAVSATVLIEVSNDGVGFMLMATITLSGTTSATDGFVSSAPWSYVRARTTAISGTGATVVVLMGG